MSHCFAASPFFSVSSPVKYTTKNYSSRKALQVQSIILATCHEDFVQVEPNYSVGMSKAKFCQVYSFKLVVHRCFTGHCLYVHRLLPTASLIFQKL